jgi:hypothetical protein
MKTLSDVGREYYATCQGFLERFAQSDMTPLEFCRREKILLETLEYHCTRASAGHYGKKLQAALGSEETVMCFEEELIEAALGSEETVMCSDEELIDVANALLTLRDALDAAQGASR